MLKRRIIIIPGNGEGCESSNFYPWLASQLRERGHEVILNAMPEANAAPLQIWLPFILALGVDAESVLIGHSSGACAVLRIAEKSQIHAVIAVSMTDNDLGDSGERESGWYNAPWEYENMRKNVSNLIVFASDDDPFIPLATQRRVGECLEKAGIDAGASSATFEYLELHRRSHFFAQKQPEILAAVIRVAEAPSSSVNTCAT